MATSKRRLNISLAPDMDKALTELARRDNTPQATKVAELVRIGFEAEEDTLLDRIATGRYKTPGTRLSHAKVWK